MQNKLAGIQTLRGLAATLVVVHHALEQSNGAVGRFSPDWLTTLGASGVDIFFVISGFIMMYVCFGPGVQTPTPTDFLLHRAIRIYPFYWVCCLAILLISAIGFLKHHSWSGGTIFASFALLPSTDKLIGVSWTLVCEVYFYLIFAGALLCRSMTATAIVTASAIGFFMVLGNFLPPGPSSYLLANPIQLEFCLGLLLGLFFVWAKNVRRSWPIGILFGIIGIVLLAVASALVPHPSTNGLIGFSRVIAWGLPALSVVAASLETRSASGPVSSGLFILGNASYALYLTHIFVMIGYGWILKWTNISQISQLMIVPIVILISIAIGLAAHVTIERPLMGLGAKLLARRSRKIELETP